METNGEAINLENGALTNMDENGNETNKVSVEEKLDQDEQLTFTVRENPPVHITICYAIQVNFRFL